jgi:hypothetical protein
MASGLRNEGGFPTAGWWLHTDTLAIELLPAPGSGRFFLFFRLNEEGRGVLALSDTTHVDFAGIPVLDWKETSREPITARQYLCPAVALHQSEWNSFRGQDAIDRTQAP